MPFRRNEFIDIVSYKSFPAFWNHKSPLVSSLAIRWLVSAAQIFFPCWSLLIKRINMGLSSTEENKTYQKEFSSITDQFNDLKSHSGLSYTSTK